MCVWLKPFQLETAFAASFLLLRDLNSIAAAIFSMVRGNTKGEKKGASGKGCGRGNGKGGGGKAAGGKGGPSAGHGNARGRGRQKQDVVQAHLKTWTGHQTKKMDVRLAKMQAVCMKAMAWGL